MKSIRLLFLGLWLLPTLVFAAFDDVTLTTDTILSVGGYTLNVTGSSAVVQSIVVNDSNFSVTLSSGSSIQITSPTYQQLSVDVDTFTTSNNCADNTSVLTLASSGPSGTVTVTPTATICSTPASSGDSGNGGHGGDSTDQATTISQNKLVIKEGQTTGSSVRINVAFNKTTSIHVVAPDSSSVKQVYLNVRGRHYVARATSQKDVYLITIPAISSSGSFPFTLTADYGFTTKSQKGVLVVAGAPKAAFSLNSPIVKSINDVFQIVYRKLPTFLDWKYWADRVLKGEKSTIQALLGAMQWQHLFKNK